MGSPDVVGATGYLPPANEARQVLIESGIETDARDWLVNRRERLHECLGEVGAKLAHGRLEGVRLENARLRITPYDAVTPPAGERLDRAIDALMPGIRITDLLWEVNLRTGFLDAFTNLRSGRVHANRATILAGEGPCLESLHERCRYPDMEDDLERPECSFCGAGAQSPAPRGWFSAELEHVIDEDEEMAAVGVWEAVACPDCEEQIRMIAANLEAEGWQPVPDLL